jgi:signal transduction histidine kinase
MFLPALLDEKTIEHTKQVFYKIAQTGQTGQVENLVKCGDGKRRFFSWSISWSEARRGFFCVAHDVSEIKEIQALKQNFLAMVSHDIRAPLQAVAMSLELLLAGKRGALSDSVRKEIEKADRGTKRLKELADDLLDLGKLESGKQSLECLEVHAFNVCAAAKEALEDLANSAGTKMVGPKGDALIWGNQNRLVQAVVNLLSNAIKFSPRDSTITLSLATRDKLVEIAVTDQGPGMPAEDIPLVFQKFRQSTAKANVAVKGTGLGLAIVKAIVDAHQGEVGIRSELGKGTTFWFTIPACTGEGEEL